MTDETQTMEGVVRDAVLVQEREPVPTAAGEPHPKGDGSTYLVVRHGYGVQTLAGPRAPRRMHVFDDLATFAAWLGRKADGARTELFVGADTIDVVLDPGELEHEQPTCLLRLEPEIQAFREAFGKPLSLKAFHDLVRAFRRFITDSEGLLSQLRVVTVRASDELQSEIDETGAVRLSGMVGRRDVSGRVPPEIIVRTGFYQGLRTEPFGVEILVNVSLDPLQFVLTCPGWDLVVAAARDRVRAQLAEDLAEEFTVVLGRADVRERALPRAR